jgi:hypothetical protein
LPAGCAPHLCAVALARIQEQIRRMEPLRLPELPDASERPRGRAAGRYAGAMAVLTIVAIALLLVRLADPGAPAWPATFPADMDRLGLTVAPADAKPALGPQEVLDVAKRDAQGLLALDGITVGTWLTTNPAGELTWVVRVAGFEFEKGGPPDPAGSPGPVHAIHFAYIFVPDSLDREVVTVLKE